MLICSKYLQQLEISLKQALCKQKILAMASECSVKYCVGLKQRLECVRPLYFISCWRLVRFSFKGNLYVLALLPEEMSNNRPVTVHLL